MDMKKILLTSVAVIALTTTAYAQSSTDELAARVKSLEATIEQLRGELAAERAKASETKPAAAPAKTEAALDHSSFEAGGLVIVRPLPSVSRGGEAPRSIPGADLGAWHSKTLAWDDERLGDQARSLASISTARAYVIQTFLLADKPGTWSLAVDAELIVARLHATGACFSNVRVNDQPIAAEVSGINRDNGRARIAAAVPIPEPGAYKVEIMTGCQATATARNREALKIAVRVKAPGELDYRAPGGSLAVRKAKS
jgi:outer membrane murein-binding lipoprotein Lpp